MLYIIIIVIIIIIIIIIIIRRRRLNDNIKIVVKEIGHRLDSSGSR
jgi:hypothetical protein